MKSELTVYVELRKILTEHFDEGELRTLCFDLGIDYDNLRGTGKADKARELVIYCDHHKCTSKLVDTGGQQRPEIAWPEQSMPPETLEGAKRISLQASNGQYLCAKNEKVVANQDQISEWAIFELFELGESKIALRAWNGQYLCAEGGGGRKVVANRNIPSRWETFKLVELGDNKVALCAWNGQYLRAEKGGGCEIVADRNEIFEWETFVVTWH